MKRGVGGSAEARQGKRVDLRGSSRKNNHLLQKGIKRLEGTNTCFINAALQVVFSLPSFHRPDKQARACLSGCIYRRLVGLYNELRTHPVPTPDWIRDLYQNGNDQGDSSEFMSVIITNIAEGQRAVQAGGKYALAPRRCSGACRLFGTSLQTVIREDFVCPCGHTENPPTTTSVVISIPSSEGCLQSAIGWWRSKTDQCRGCRSPLTGQITHSFNDYPRTLLVHVDRVLSLGAGRIIKLDNPFLYPLAFAAAEVHPGAPGSFTLSAVVLHQGDAGGGHYTSVVYWNQRWYNFDDAIVAPVEGRPIQDGKPTILIFQWTPQATAPWPPFVPPPSLPRSLPARFELGKVLLALYQKRLRRLEAQRAVLRQQAMSNWQKFKDLVQVHRQDYALAPIPDSAPVWLRFKEAPDLVSMMLARAVDAAAFSPIPWIESGVVVAQDACSVLGHNGDYGDYIRFLFVEDPIPVLRAYLCRFPADADWTMECLHLLGDNMQQLATWYGQQRTTYVEVVNLVNSHQDDRVVHRPANHAYLQYTGASQHPPLIRHYQDVLAKAQRRLDNFLEVMRSLNQPPRWIICSSPALQFALEDEQARYCDPNVGDSEAILIAAASQLSFNSTPDGAIPAYDAPDEIKGIAATIAATLPTPPFMGAEFNRDKYEKLVAAIKSDLDYESDLGHDVLSEEELGWILADGVAAVREEEGVVLFCTLGKDRTACARRKVGSVWGRVAGASHREALDLYGRVHNDGRLPSRQDVRIDLQPPSAVAFACGDESIEPPTNFITDTMGGFLNLFAYKPGDYSQLAQRVLRLSRRLCLIGNDLCSLWGSRLDKLFRNNALSRVWRGMTAQEQVTFRNVLGSPSVVTLDFAGAQWSYTANVGQPYIVQIGPQEDDLSIAIPFLHYGAIAHASAEVALLYRHVQRLCSLRVQVLVTACRFTPVGADSRRARLEHILERANDEAQKVGLEDALEDALGQLAILSHTLQSLRTGGGTVANNGGGGGEDDDDDDEDDDEDDEDDEDEDDEDGGGGGGDERAAMSLMVVGSTERQSQLEQLRQEAFQEEQNAPHFLQSLTWLALLASCPSIHTQAFTNFFMNLPAGLLLARLRQFPCRRCRKCFFANGPRETHQAICTKVQCSRAGCRRAFDSEDERKEHEAKCTRVMCSRPGCRRAFDSEDERKEHEAICTKVQCSRPGCQRAFNSEDERKEHEATCTKLMCGKAKKGADKRGDHEKSSIAKAKKGAFNSKPSTAPKTRKGTSRKAPAETPEQMRASFAQIEAESEQNRRLASLFTLQAPLK